MEYFTDAFKRYTDFSGRASRQQYWMFILFVMIISFVLALIDTLLGMIALYAIFNLIIFIPSLSIAARRLHDTGRSGWWQLIILLPIIGIIVLLVFLIQDSHDDNEYGASSKST